MLKVAVHKFTSCDGCQLSFVHQGLRLLSLTEHIQFVHFAELGYVDEQAQVDVAFVEGSISTPKCLTRIHEIRLNSRYLITLGACATAGGIQALRNLHDVEKWKQQIYATPSVIDALKTSTPVSEHVKVDFELWGCPIDKEQLAEVIQSLINGCLPHIAHQSVCMECKQLHQSCVMVTAGTPCMGPVTQAGCNALCPSLKRGCYGCFGPKENANVPSLVQQFKTLGLSEDDIQKRFEFICSHTDKFKEFR